jgi:hypothetical protein
MPYVMSLQGSRRSDWRVLNLYWGVQDFSIHLGANMT